MSFKDKLGSIKNRKQSSKKMPKFSENLQNKSDFPSLDDISGVDDALADKAIPGKKLGKITDNSNAQQLKRNISLLSLLLVGLLGVLAYLFMQKDTSSTPAAPVVAKPSEAQPPADLSVNTESPIDTAASATANAADMGVAAAEDTEVNIAQIAEDDSVASTAGDDSAMTATVDTTEKLPEVIDRAVPDNQVQAAEELDLLKDERQRLSEQELLLKEQISAQEKLTELKAKRIEMLQKKIANAEGAAN